MSDASTGPGCWLGTDGRWHTDVRSMPPPVAGTPRRPPPSRVTATGLERWPASSPGSNGRAPYKRWWFWAAAVALVALGVGGADFARRSGIGPSATVSSTTRPVPTTTPAPSVSAAAASYNTVFNLTDNSIPAKESAIEDGAALQTALRAALSWSLASSATGATVQSVTLLPGTSCRVVQVATPCAQVNYDIIGPNGQLLTWDQIGYATAVDGRWLVASSTVCDVLTLFYQAEGNSGTAPGCPASGPGS